MVKELRVHADTLLWRSRLNDRCYKKAATKSEGSRHGVSHGAGRRGVGAGR